VLTTWPGREKRDAPAMSPRPRFDLVVVAEPGAGRLQLRIYPGDFEITVWLTPDEARQVAADRADRLSQPREHRLPTHRVSE
jgi:hypothetical protein